MTAIDETETIPQVNGHAVRIPGPRPPIEDQRPADLPETSGGEAPQRTRTSPTAAARKVLRAAKTAATHQHTRTAVRQGVYVLAGGRHVVRRTWNSRTTAPLDEARRAASAVGDHANA